MKHTITLLLLCLPILLCSQEKTFKEIKSLDQTIACKAGDKFNINGERTFLKLRSWKKELIQLKIEIVSKHQDQNQAQSDLDKIEIVFEKKGKQVTYSNSIKIDNPKDKPQSNLKVLLEITVPDYLELDIKNKFGELDMQGNYQSITSNSQFTNIMIDAFNAKAKFKTEYGDAVLKNCLGDIELVADRSNILLDNVTSYLNLDIKYGELEMHLIETTKSQKIEAQFSPIKIHISEKFDNSISLNCSNCKIECDDKIGIEFSEKNNDNQSAKLSGKKEELSIHSKIEDIKILFKNELTTAN